MDTKKIRIILTGATGMVGEGVLLECLQNENVESVLAVGRRACGRSHPKLKEIVCADLFDLSAVEDKLAGYDACLFCLGKSSVGMKEDEYYKTTYSLTMYFAGTLCRINPSISFCYISGAGTDSSEKGRHRWARVKGKTENDLMKLPFKNVFNFRPAMLSPSVGQRNVPSLLKVIAWFFPVLKIFLPAYISSIRDLARAMIAATISGCEKQILEVSDISALAKSFGPQDL
jgi:uncharacterized protein YbjT (DUF2867 family)